MGRSRIITDEQILEAAREVFLAEGFGASTVEIARRAGVSEGSIFKRFSTKEKLFFAAMGVLAVPEWVKGLKALVGTGDLKENLVNLSFQIVELLHDLVPRMVMLRSKGLPPGIHPPEPPIRRNVKSLAEFLAQEIKLGRLRSCDPEITAHILIGSLMNHVLVEQITKMPTTSATGSEEAIETSTFIHGLIDVLWQGMSPP
jgi:AcrR family transcriptional regulator